MSVRGTVFGQGFDSPHLHHRKHSTLSNQRFFYDLIRKNKHMIHLKCVDKSRIRKKDKK